MKIYVINLLERLSGEELMFFNCGAGENSSDSLGQQED